MSHAPQSHKLRYITRMDYERTCGWWVRFYSGTTLLKGALFSDKKYGGTKKALLAAQTWRDEHEGTVSKTPGRVTYVSQNRRNVSGVVGVALRVNPNRYGLARYSWAALWSERGSPRTRTFSVATHGYRRGFQMALDHRHDMLGLPRIVKQPPALKRILAKRACEPKTNGSPLAAGSTQGT